MNKVIQGDCLELMKDIPDKSIDCIITDPPYGIDYQSAWRTDKSKWKPKIANDKAPYTVWADEAYRIMKDNTGILCFTRWDTEQDFREALTKSGFKCKQQIIWDKEVHGMGDLTGDFASQHENIIFAHKGRFTFKGKRPKSVFRSQRVTPTELKHPNEKPIDLMEKLVSSITLENDVVLDLFAGSGTTGVACKNLNRQYILIEKEPEYVEIIKKRLL
jgi:site-specific DNA-methyltransferase (adenine-specific)